MHLYFLDDDGVYKKCDVGSHDSGRTVDIQFTEESPKAKKRVPLSESIELRNPEVLFMDNIILITGWLCQEDQNLYKFKSFQFRTTPRQKTRKRRR